MAGSRSPFDYPLESLPGSERAPVLAEPPPPVVPALPRRRAPAPLEERLYRLAASMRPVGTPGFVLDADVAQLRNLLAEERRGWLIELGSLKTTAPSVPAPEAASAPDAGAPGSNDNP